MEAHLLEELRRLEAAAVHLLCRAAAAESRFRGGEEMRRRGGGGALLCCSSPRCGVGKWQLREGGEEEEEAIKAGGCDDANRPRSPEELQTRHADAHADG